MRKLTHLTLALALAVGAVAMATGPASGTGNAPLALSGTGTHQPPEWGLTRVAADVDSRTIDGTFTAGLRIDTMPAPGECEPAWMNFAVQDGRHWFDFVSVGEVCGQTVQPPTSVVYAVYTGEFDLYDSSRPGFTDTQGWVSVRLATDGRASVEVYAG
jgi:hypothetical protein